MNTNHFDREEADRLYLLVFYHNHYTPPIIVIIIIDCLRKLTTRSNHNRSSGSTTLRANGFNSLDNVHALGDGTKHTVLAIEPGSFVSAKEELHIIGKYIYIYILVVASCVRMYEMTNSSGPILTNRKWWYEQSSTSCGCGRVIAVDSRKKSANSMTYLTSVGVGPSIRHAVEKSECLQ
jgi:hypothetical protein